LHCSHRRPRGALSITLREEIASAIKIMWRLVVYTLCLAGAVQGACRNLTGSWRNSKQSILTVTEQRGDALLGHYSTAVELTKGAAGHSA
jgi:hypothetical protein